MMLEAADETEKRQHIKDDERVREGEWDPQTGSASKRQIMLRNSFDILTGQDGDDDGGEDDGDCSEAHDSDYDTTTPTTYNRL